MSYMSACGGQSIVISVAMQCRRSGLGSARLGSGTLTAPEAGVINSADLAAGRYRPGPAVAAGYI